MTLHVIGLHVDLYKWTFITTRNSDCSFILLSIALQGGRPLWKRESLLWRHGHLLHWLLHGLPGGVQLRALV